MKIDWSADAFVLADLRNRPGSADIPDSLIRSVLDTGRAVIFQNAWVDVCSLDLPCGGDRARCPSTCDRGFGNSLFAAARIAVFVSPLHQALIRRALDVPLPRSVVMAPWIDTGKFRRLGLERDIDVLYVGTISRQKGYHRLLERFGARRLTFAGVNALEEPVQGQYLGPVSYEDLPPLYNRARTFAHLPEWYEPMGRTVVEAALCGCEVVTNDRVGAMSFSRAAVSDPVVISTARERFWADLERAIQEAI